MNKKEIIKGIIDILIKGFIVLSIGLGLLTLFKPDMVKHFIEWMKVIIMHLGYWNYGIVFMSSLIEGFPLLGVVVPGQNILLLVGGFFAHMGFDNLIFVIIIASIGAIISNYVGYFLGVYYGESFFKKYGLWVGIGTTEVKFLKKGIKKWGVWGIIVGKFHNLARAFVPFIAGSMGMNKKSFFIYNIIGSTLRAIVMVILGVAFAQYYETVIDYFGYIVLGIMIVALGYVYIYKRDMLMEYINDKNKEMEELSLKNTKNEK